MALCLPQRTRKKHGRVSTVARAASASGGTVLAMDSWSEASAALVGLLLIMVAFKSWLLFPPKRGAHAGRRLQWLFELLLFFFFKACFWFCADTLVDYSAVCPSQSFQGPPRVPLVTPLCLKNGSDVCPTSCSGCECERPLALAAASCHWPAHSAPSRPLSFRS